MRLPYFAIVALLSAAQLSKGATHGQVRNEFDVLNNDSEDEKRVQDIVTWDEHSVKIFGERLMIFAAEMHPFRMPVPSLWLDIMQKIKALGFNSLSFYVDWALLEGKPGEFHAEGVFSLKAFFDAALEAGIWLIARPGPYINAEVSGGGFPGWMQRINGTLRYDDDAYIKATSNYARNINLLIAEAQITNGGPVILYQPENEYFYRNSRSDPDPPDPEYIARIIEQTRDSGIIVPLHSNDGDESDISRVINPGTNEVDMIGYDAYPLGFDCSDITTWHQSVIPWEIHQWHDMHNPDGPLSTPEFQGGSFSNWGAANASECAKKFNHEFERVFYKDLYSLGFSIVSVYMTYGGTNWGNLGMPGGTTSYDYGAAISEDRLINREKYSELKLQAQLFRVAPGYLTTRRDNTRANYSSTDAVSVIARLNENSEDGHFFVARQARYWDQTHVNYSLTLPTSMGNITIPQLGGYLTLRGRDSKVHVTDFDVGGTNLLYSTAEIFTWKDFDEGKVLIVYGGLGELHELAIRDDELSAKVVLGSGLNIQRIDGYFVMQFTASPDTRVVQIGHLQVYMIDRNSAYDYWVTDLPGNGGNLPKNYGTAVTNPKSLIVKGPYLSRTVDIHGPNLILNADFNATKKTLEIIGAPKSSKKLILNKKIQVFSKTKLNTWVAEIDNVPTTKPALPDLKSLEWHKIDSLPEISSSYDDSNWTRADLNETYNSWSLVTQKTPTSLFASDYGYHTGALIFIGSFRATGGETTLSLKTQGGRAYVSGVWLDSRFIGSHSAGPDEEYYEHSFGLQQPLEEKTHHKIMVFIDNMGLESNWVAGNDTMKGPRGILDWSLSNGEETMNTTIDWTLTGNYGGEDYLDKARGPLNEGGLFAERHGFHLPRPPVAQFERGSPFDGFTGPGIYFYAAHFHLDIPVDHDVPLYIVFESPDMDARYRAVVYINGWQFGKYINNLGTQAQFPVPEGIMNHRGENWIGVMLFGLDEGGASMNFRLDSALPILTGMKPVHLVDSPAWSLRHGAY